MPISHGGLVTIRSKFILHPFSLNFIYRFALSLISLSTAVIFWIPKVAAFSYVVDIACLLLSTEYILEFLYVFDNMYDSIPLPHPMSNIEEGDTSDD